MKNNILKIKTKITCVRYPGGKSNALKFLDKHFIKDYKEYREPFFGGGSVGLYLMQFNKDATYHINDLFYPVYCFWKTLYNKPNEMVEFLLKKKKMYSNKEDARELHKSCRNNIDKADEFTTGCLWYILNKTSFSGMSMIGSYAPLAWEQNFSENCIVNLPKTTALMKSVKEVKITNLDYTKLLNNKGENVFIFLDPPYKIPHSLYGKKGDMHKDFNHKKFAEDIKNCCHKWMITYNEDSDIKGWFSDYEQLNWSLTYTMKSAKREEVNEPKIDGNRKTNKTDKTGKEGKELLIWNYEK
jgi:DNA adenine methylase